MVDKPANDNTRHRYAEITRHTKLYQGAKKYGTFWPEEGSTEWWEEYLKKPGVKKFYKTNANTFEGLEYVAKHFGVWTTGINSRIRRDRCGIYLGNGRMGFSPAAGNFRFTIHLTFAALP